MGLRKCLYFLGELEVGIVKEALGGCFLDSEFDVVSRYQHLRGIRLAEIFAFFNYVFSLSSVASWDVVHNLLSYCQILHVCEQGQIP